MGYRGALFKRMWFGQASKRMGRRGKKKPPGEPEQKTPQKKGMPIVYAVALMIAFYLLTADLLPSIIIPIVIWVIIKYK